MTLHIIFKLTRSKWIACYVMPYSKDHIIINIKGSVNEKRIESKRVSKSFGNSCDLYFVVFIIFFWGFRFRSFWCGCIGWTSCWFDTWRNCHHMLDKKCSEVNQKTYHSRVSRFDLVRKSLSIARVGIFPSYKLLYAHHSLIHDHLPLMGMAKSSSLAISTWSGSSIQV